MRAAKVSAAGNHFLIFGLADPSQFSPAMVKEMCEPAFGLGADGVLGISEREGKRSWWFKNADGSHADFCGNGARALALFEILCLGAPTEGVRETPAGVVNYKQTDPQTISLQLPATWVQPFPLSADALSIIQQWLPERPTREIEILQAGVPHACLLYSHAFPFPPLEDWVRSAEKIHTELRRRGEDVNLTVVWPDEVINKMINDAINTTASPAFAAMTFERGIRGATLACGSGAISAARFVSPKGKTTVRMPGGKLEISFRSDGTELRGPALWVASLEHTRWEWP